MSTRNPQIEKMKKMKAAAAVALLFPTFVITEYCRAFSRNLLWIIPIYLFVVWAIFFFGITQRILKELPKAFTPNLRFSAPAFPKGNNDPLLIYRFSAAIIVFISHCFLMFGQSLDFGSWRWLFAGAAHSGMIMFFTLSGFLMGKGFTSGRYALNNEGIAHFCRNRLTRIVPLMVFAAAIFALIFKRWAWSDFKLIYLPILGFYYDGVPGYSGIGAFWSLSREMQFYLVFPFIFLLFPKATRLFSLITIFALLIAQHFCRHLLADGFDFEDYRVYASFLSNLPFFLAGAALTLAETNRKRLASPIQLWAETAFFVVTIELVGSYLMNKLGRTGSFQLPIAILSLAAIYHLSRSQFVSSRFALVNRAYFLTCNLGLLTYGFYLWHSGIGGILAIWLHAPTNFISYFLYSAALFTPTLITSLFTYLFVELTSAPKIRPLDTSQQAA